MIKLVVCIPFFVVSAIVLILSILSEKEGFEKYSRQAEVLSTTFLPLSVLIAVVFYFIAKANGW